MLRIAMADAIEGEPLFIRDAPMKAFNALVARFTEHGKRAFFEASMFPWARALEDGSAAISGELQRALAPASAVIPSFGEVSPLQQPIAGTGWTTLFFFVYGREIYENTAQYPATANLVRAIPGMTSAMFSIMQPGVRIPPHRGPYKGVLRYHLGLMIPAEEQCGIRVDGKERHWQEGQSLIFDDTYEHEVWNSSSAPRAILFVDFMRPLPAPLRALNRLLLALAKYLDPEVRTAHANARRFALNAPSPDPSSDPSSDRARTSA